MEAFEIALMLATFLVSLVAGFVFAFAVVVMPGIKNLNDGEFIRAFQAMDGVIQKNQPIFMTVWMGSVVALAASVALGFGSLDGSDLLLMMSAAVAYLAGVQLPTAAINVPLNNRLQTLDVGAMSESAHASARKSFERRWNSWNIVRTGFAILVSAQLMILLFAI